mgnify:CR=1 FL=1
MAEDKNKNKGRRGHGVEKRLRAKDMYVIEDKSMEEISKELDIVVPTLKNWSSEYGWELARRNLKNQVGLAVHDDALKSMVDLRRKSVSSYMTAQDRAVSALEEKDEVGRPTLTFRDAGAAVSAMDTAIKGAINLTEETVPLQVTEHLLSIFLESIEESLKEDKHFKPESANKLLTKYVQKARAFTQFWSSGGKTAKAMFKE